MQSPFTYSLDSLKRINGNAKGDYEVARKAVQEMEDFVSENVKVIDEYLNLKRILTNQSQGEIESIIISIKHVFGGLDDLNSFHRSGQLNDIFDISHHKMAQTIENIEKRAKDLISSMQS